MASKKQKPNPAPPNAKSKRLPRLKPGKQSRPVTRKPQSSIAALSKKDQVVAMLRHPEGTTIAAIGKATGWRKHTVRGFFSAVVRRKLHLELVSIKDSARVYRIVEP